MNRPLSCCLSGVALIAAVTTATARSDVPRQTFGRVPVQPIELVLLTPPEKTAAPLATFAAVWREERTLPLTALSARTLRFEDKLPRLELRPLAETPPLPPPALRAPERPDEGEPRRS